MSKVLCCFKRSVRVPFHIDNLYSFSFTFSFFLLQHFTSCEMKCLEIYHNL